MISYFQNLAKVDQIASVLIFKSIELNTASIKNKNTLMTESK